MQRWMNRASALALAAGTLLALPAGATPDLQIENGADYTRFISAIRASEYVRDDLFAEGRSPRIVPVLAGLAAFAAKNEHATGLEFDNFVVAYDAALRAARPADPDLVRPGSVLIAVRGARVEPTGVLAGTDTRVADDVFELLEIEIPGVDGIDQVEERMRQFERRAAQPVEYSSAFVDILLSLFMDVDPLGRERQELEGAATAYLQGQGYSVVFGVEEPSRTAINAGIAQLPTFAEFTSLRSDQAAAEALRDSVGGVIDEDGNVVSPGDIDTLVSFTDDIVADIGLLQIPEDVIAESVEFRDRLEGGDPNAISEINALADQFQDRVRLTGEARARALGRTALLSQTDFVQIRLDADTYTTEAIEEQKENAGFAYAESAATIALSGVAFAEGIGAFGAKGQSSPTLAVGALLTGGFEIGKLFGAGGESSDEATQRMLRELSKQLGQMQDQLNSRFDAVDAQLGTLNLQLTNGITNLTNQGNLTQSSVEALSASVIQNYSTLTSIEDALFGYIDDSVIRSFTFANAEFLNYRNEESEDLPYSGLETNFVEGSTTFYVECVDSTSTAGTYASNSLFGLQGAAEKFGNGAAIGPNINALNFVPQSSFASGGRLRISGSEVFAGPLLPRAVRRPSRWTQAASMFVEFAEENPWYFNFRYAGQVLNTPLPELDEVIGQGQDLVDLSLAARDPALFDALLFEAREAASRLEDEMKLAIEDKVRNLVGESDLSSPGFFVDPWGGSVQPGVEALTPQVDVFEVFRGTFGPFNQTPLGTLPYDGNGSPFGVWNALIGPNPTGSFITNRNDLRRVGILATVTESLVSPTPVRYVLNTSPALDSFACTGGGPIFTEFLAQSSRWEVGRRGAVWVGRGYTGAAAGTFFTQPFNYCNQDQYTQTDLNNLNINDVLNIWNGFLDTGGLWQEIIPQWEGSFNEAPYASRVLGPFGGSAAPNWDVVHPVFADGTNGGNIQNFANQNLFALREIVRDEIEIEIANPSTPLARAFDDYEDAIALLDAYVTLAFDDYTKQSELLRSALRAAPGESSIGVRGVDLNGTPSSPGFFERVRAEDAQSTASEPLAVDLPTIATEINRRLDVIEGEINAAFDLAEVPGATGLDRYAGMPTFPYIEFVLAELESLRDGAFDLTTPDTYVLTEQVSSIDAASGVIANDVAQLRLPPSPLMPDATFRVFEIDPTFSSASPGFIAPQGTLSLSPDGSFTYTAPSDEASTDVFTYRVVGDIDNDGTPDIVSKPTSVVINFEPVFVPPVCDLADTFGSQTTLSTGPDARDVLADDFNGDGAPDLAVVTSEDGIKIFLNDGNGTLQESQTFSTRLDAVKIDKGDLDGDGSVDLAIAVVFDGDVVFLANDGNGVFFQETLFSAGTVDTRVNAATIADIDGDGGGADGTGDAVYISSQFDQVRIRYKSPLGFSFNSQDVYLVANNPLDIKSVDLDLDGLVDIVISYGGGAGVGVLLNNGDGTLANVQNYPTGGSSPDFEVGDVNGDTFPDVVTAVSDADGFAVLLNQGDGTLGAATPYPMGENTRSVSLGDINGDGFLDVATADRDDATVSFRLNDGSGTFGPREPLAGVTFPAASFIADITGDRLAEVGAVGFSTVGSGNDTLVYYENVCTDEPPCPADINGDGVVTGVDFTDFIIEFGTGGTKADINGDGLITGVDFTDFIIEFGVGCP